MRRRIGEVAKMIRGASTVTPDCMCICGRLIRQDRVRYNASRIQPSLQYSNTHSVTNKQIFSFVQIVQNGKLWEFKFISVIGVNTFISNYTMLFREISDEILDFKIL